jgi:hypothetical protein
MNRKLKATLITAAGCVAAALLLAYVYWCAAHPIVGVLTLGALLLSWAWTCVYLSLD